MSSHIEHIIMEMRTLLMEKLKNALRPLYWKCISRPLYRRLRTSNYTSGKVALGEKNFYHLGRDWVTVDIDQADFNVEFNERMTLPFADGSQRLIYSCHMIEHIEHSALQRLLRESHRILKRGGFIRLEAPDAESIVTEYRSGGGPILRHLVKDNVRDLVQRRGMPSIYGEEHVAVMGALSNYLDRDRDFFLPVTATKEEFDEKLRTCDLDAFGDWCVSLQTPAQRGTHGHINVLYFEKLRGLLVEAGFKNIVRRPNGVTNIPSFNLGEVERIGADRAVYSFYVEAEK